MFDCLPDAPRAPIKPCLNMLSGLLSMSVDLRFQEPWWVTCPSGSAHSWVSPVLPFLPAPPCVPDASVLGGAPSLDPGSIFPPLRSVFHLLTRISISQTRLRHDFDFQGGHLLSYRASPDAAGPSQTRSERNPALLSRVPAGAWKACPLSHTLDPTPRPLTTGLPRFPWARVQEAFTHTPKLNSLALF